MILQLGKHASDWKKMIEERPTPLDELGVDKKARVAVVAIEDDEFLKLLATRVPELAGEEAGDLDLLFVGVEHRADLSQLSALSRRLRHGGVLWALTREKGRAPEAHEIAAAGRSAGLLSGNVVEVSRTLQAVRLNKA